LATLRPPVTLPGAELPAGFGAGCQVVGYVVPMPASPAACDAGVELDRWLRDHGFPPATVPFPARVAFAGDGVVVQCRAGGHGSPRVWRYAPLLRYLDATLLDALSADVISGPGDGFVLELLGGAVPNASIV
jgi:hypothetical protein